MNNLKLLPLSKEDKLAWPDNQEQLKLTSPAVCFFKDFETQQPSVIDPSLSAIDAKLVMQRSKAKHEIVVNQKGDVVGLLPKERLIERKIIRKVSEGVSRIDVRVADLMIPVQNLKALDIQQVNQSAIIDVIDTMKRHNQNFCIVIDYQTHKIRGILSTSEISELLGNPIEINKPGDFYRVFSGAN